VSGSAVQFYALNEAGVPDDAARPRA
jgi:hypothetical protein